MLSSKRKEKISAFLDNDMQLDELMSFSLSGETDDAEVVRRYQIVGDTLRGEVSESSFVDVSHAVREALANEQSYSIEPMKTAPGHSPESKSTASNANSLFGLSSWFRPVAGMAVAASVAVVMVVTLSEQSADGFSSPALSPSVAINDGIQPVVNPAVQVAAEEKNQLNNTGPVNQNVDPRLVNQHLEYATQDALQGRLPLVRAVSYEADK